MNRPKYMKFRHKWRFTIFTGIDFKDWNIEFELFPRCHIGFNKPVIWYKDSTPDGILKHSHFVPGHDFYFGWLLVAFWFVWYKGDVDKSIANSVKFGEEVCEKINKSRAEKHKIE